MKLNYFLSETAMNLRRNVLMSIAAISTVAISLLLLGGVQILGMVVNNMTSTWEAKVEISAYFRDDASDGEIKALTADLSEMPEVQNVTYVSKAEAFEEFKDQFADNQAIVSTLPSDALPASLRIKLYDADMTEEVAARIVGAPGVDDVRFGGEIIKLLLRVNALLRSITFGMSLVLMIAASALIANAIRLGIYARREEIGIMKLVGATNWFIRIPFMLEGLFAALVGAAIAGGVVIAANGLLFDRMSNALPFLRQVLNFSTSDIAAVVLILAGVGALVGLVGSSLALRRFLEV